MDLGSRMKGYEKAYNIVLPRRIPMILRIDGVCFHSLLKHAQKPFDHAFRDDMDKTSEAVLKGVQGAVFVYTQSDEINVLINNYASLEYEPWFNNELQKIVSISASIATEAFNNKVDWEKGALFDSRAFVLPKEEVCNYFLWRQRDWTRNSVQMVARTMYTHKQCQNKNNSQLQDMMSRKGKSWNKLPIWKKRGRCFYKKEYLKNAVTRTKIVVDDNIPIFSKDREFIDKFVNIEPR